MEMLPQETYIYGLGLPQALVRYLNTLSIQKGQENRVLLAIAFSSQVVPPRVFVPRGLAQSLVSNKIPADQFCNALLFLNRDPQVLGRFSRALSEGLALPKTQLLVTEDQGTRTFLLIL